MYVYINTYIYKCMYALRYISKSKSGKKMMKL